jgi:hypothetical protein
LQPALRRDEKMPPRNSSAVRRLPPWMWWNSSASLRERSADPARHYCRPQSARHALKQSRILHSSQPKCASLRKARWKRQPKPQMTVLRRLRASRRQSCRPNRYSSRPQVRCGLRLKCGHRHRNGCRRCFRHHATHRPHRHVARTRGAARDSTQLRNKLRMQISAGSSGLDFDAGPAVSCHYPLDAADDRSDLSPAL